MNAYIDEAYAVSNADVLPGQFVLISILDSGAGMDRDTLRRAFEPFFTTKPVGQGTDLPPGLRSKTFGEANPGEPALIDVVLPGGMTGAQWQRSARNVSRLKVLFTTGRPCFGTQDKAKA
jgi:hypothetical protein